MNAKKCLVFLLSMLLLLPMLVLPAFAAGDPVLDYEVVIDGLEVKEAKPGDIITVTLYLQRTDSDEPYTMYAMQSELRYDSTFFELVEDSVSLYTGVNYTDIAVGGGFREFYMNFLSFTGGVEWQARTRVGSFQLRVIGTEGTSTITNEDYLVSKPGGSGSYECSSNELTVILSSDCTVKFETNGGSKIDPVNAIYGETIERPDDPVREGKEFVGWYRDIHLTEEWNFDTDTVTGNMTLYAKWVDKPVPSGPVGTDEPVPSDPVGTDEPVPSDPVGTDEPVPSDPVGTDEPVPSDPVGTDEPVPSDPVGTDEPVPSDPVETDKPEPPEPTGELCASCGRILPASGKSLCGQCRMLRTLIVLVIVLIMLVIVLIVCLLVLIRWQKKKEIQKNDPAYIAADRRDG